MAETAYSAQEIVGYVVWNTAHRTIHEGRVYANLPTALGHRVRLEAFHGIGRFEVRGVLLDGGPTHAL
jgi:hypothetical protein